MNAPRTDEARLSGRVLGWALVAGALGLLAVEALPARAADKDVEAQLAETRAAIQRILRDESDVAAETEKADEALRQARAAASAAAVEAKAANDAVKAAEAIELHAQEDLATRQAALGPRLLARYKLLRSGGGAALLLADSPADLLRRARAFDRILEADLEGIEGARVAAQVLAGARSSREMAKARAAERLAQAEASLQAAQGVADSREELLASLRGERRLHERTLAALHQAQERLAEKVEKLARERAAASTGFGALRGSLHMPVEGAVIEVLFGRTVNAKFNTVTLQNGLDLRAPQGADVTAVAPGKVVFADWFRGYGNLVILDHGDGFHSLYGHLDRFDVSVGEQVEAGRRLGFVGDSGSLKGAYLYFELRESGRPVDPLPWVRKR
ncbi:murein hydrolase activator EnvC family protein [Vulgatibacter incomptus]|uniref:Peptidase, M23/M37 family n=1 Tax=Vulgatibacter incomptus TaxID=1391653 RepID=A0A0K1PA17_9BACT|nr:M23 family metallopeptidase [Vulgatibacter incomptus]AKU90347.1 Peptidase, M23/M37 family [Vulgatibacter incomptus]